MRLVPAVVAALALGLLLAAKPKPCARAAELEAAANEALEEANRARYLATTNCRKYGRKDKLCTAAEARADVAEALYADRLAELEAARASCKARKRY